MEDKQTGFQCAVKKVCQRKCPRAPGAEEGARRPALLPLLPCRDSPGAAMGLPC